MGALFPQPVAELTRLKLQMLANGLGADGANGGNPAAGSNSSGTANHDARSI